jgi:hypothetical protein
MVVTREDERALIGALEQAFDYRGDVTILTTDGRAVTGYLFDRRRGDTLDMSSVRVMLEGEELPEVVLFSEIEKVEFTGRDLAHGKSFDTWVKKYIEKRRAGESAGIDSEPLD